MKQNADFQEGISQPYIIATTLSTKKFLTTYESFQMRYILGKDFLQEASEWPQEKVLGF